ncbi:MAG TPA: PilX N-terminal domain-containing pilus assembly protein [Vicinamibacteria bacterium]|nr:PilX N-terminal domain-containing pilus assembly protein [Vicinamibacteria bacterium]
MPIRRQDGFALIMALLTLMVLTFLGLTLAATTSTELQIGYNYKWSQQAFYNAEAGLELAKRFLRQQTWSVLLPKARTVAEMATAIPDTNPCGNAWLWSLCRPDTASNPSRNWENASCDTTLFGGPTVGFGVVLDHTNLTFPFQNVSNFLGQDLSGAFTVWVRRKVIANPDGTIGDDPSDATMIVTAEGVAPFTGAGASSSYGQRKKAVRYLELELRKEDPGDCENDFVGQTGQGALGANYDPCQTVEASGVGSGVTEPGQNQ